MKCLVLLTGCGLGDGSCIEETVLTYTALDKYGCDYLPVAENIQAPAVNHITEQPEGMRSVLTEAARLGRGRIRPLDEVNPAEYDALMIPGGLGLLRDGPTSGAAELVRQFAARGKRIGTMCAGIDFLRAVLGPQVLQNLAENTGADGFCRDAEGRFFYTPAFRRTASCHTMQQGIDGMIQAMQEACCAL